MNLNADFDVVTLSPSTVRVMHRTAHHIYEFAVVRDDGGRRVVSRGAATLCGTEADGLVSGDLVAAAERVAAATARHIGVID